MYIKKEIFGTKNSGLNRGIFNLIWTLLNKHNMPYMVINQLYSCTGQQPFIHQILTKLIVKMFTVSTIKLCLWLYSIPVYINLPHTNLVSTHKKSTYHPPLLMLSITDTLKDKTYNCWKRYPRQMVLNICPSINLEFNVKWKLHFERKVCVVKIHISLNKSLKTSINLQFLSTFKFDDIKIYK